MPPRSGSRTWPLGPFLSAWLLASTWISGVIFQTKELGFVALAAPLLGIALLFIPAKEKLRTDCPRTVARPPHWFATGMAIATAPLAYFLLTARGEFPFSGDHDFHLSTSLAMARFWAPVLPLFFLAGAVGIFGTRKNYARAGWAAAWAISVGAGLYFGPDAIFARFPSASYFFALPWNYLATAVGWTSPVDFIRAHNVFSIFVWLFVLRPAVVGRLPDRFAIAIGAFFFLQKDVVYYFASAYLEPWSIVVLLTAAEYLLRAAPDRRAFSLLLVGAGSLFKEPIIFCLPGFALAALPKERTFKAYSPLIACGLVASLPFALYYRFRSLHEVWRKAELLSADEAFRSARIAEIFHRFHAQFGIWGTWAVAIAVITIGVAARRIPALRRPLAAFALGAVGLTLFFFFDKISGHWLGYPRFHLTTLALVAVAFAFATEKLPRWPTGALALIAIAQLTVTVPEFARTLKPEPYRNFLEHYDAPQYFRIRAVIARAPAKISEIRTLRVQDRIGTYSLKTLAAAYPDVSRRFQIEIVPRPWDCHCTDEHTAVLMPTVLPANLFEHGHAAESRGMAQCRSDMESSCAWVVSDGYQNDTLAVLGGGLGPPGRP